MRALIISGRMVQDQELVYPLHRLLEDGFKVTLAADDAEFRGIQGVKFRANVSLDDEAEVDDEYDVLVIPGGVKCMEHLRLSRAALHIVARHEGIIGSICSGAQMLISAGLVKGRTISAYPAMRVDVENAGGKYHPGPVCVYDRIVTAPHYDHLGPWMKALLAAVESEKAHRNPAACAAAL